MAWVQLICTVSKEQAETISDALTECGAISVTYEDDADEPIYEPELGTTPLWDTTRMSALFDAETDEDSLRDQLNNLLTKVPVFRIEALEDKDWIREWMTQFEPISFGDRLWVCPSWHQPPDDKAINIMLDPGMAFGTGTHPTTALCLNWLDKIDLKDKYVIDYGCGSGILAIAAALLGAKRVIGVDIDPQALQATQDNAKRNGVKIDTYLPEDCPAETGDIFIANILAGPLQALSPVFTALCHTNTQLVLSGILESQAEPLMQHYKAWFDLDAPVIKEDWVRITGNYRG